MSAIERAVRGNSLTYREALASAVLAKDGWSVAELAMTMQTSERAIRRALEEQGLSTETTGNRGRDGI